MLCSLQEAYFRYMAENPTAGLTQEEEDENIDYDSDGNPIAPTTKKIILPLPPIDHSEVSWQYWLSTGSESASTFHDLKLVILSQLFGFFSFYRLITLPLRKTSTMSTRSWAASLEPKCWN